MKKNNCFYIDGIKCYYDTKHNGFKTVISNELFLCKEELKRNLPFLVEAQAAAKAAKAAQAVSALFAEYNYRGYIITKKYFGYKVDTLNGIHYNIEDAFDAIDLDIEKGGD